jgi:hypothetical protein
VGIVALDAIDCGTRMLHLRLPHLLRFVRVARQA